MEDHLSISPALFPRLSIASLIHTDIPLRMGNRHHDVVCHLPLVETAPAATVRVLPYSSVSVELALATDSGPLPRGSNEVSTERTSKHTTNMAFTALKGPKMQR